MKARRQQAGEDALTISRRSTRPPTSTENSDTIPIDLIIEILLRLPGKSIARCRCVCKLWASMLRGTGFTELFLTRSRARPQILLSFRKDGELFFFSTPQVRNSGLITATYHMKLPCDHSSKFNGPVGGLVCLTHDREYRRTAAVICNPSTGQALPLPNVKTMSVLVYSFLGFDPIDKQLKLLSMTSKDYGNCKEHQVLTLGTGELSWRMVECSISHFYLQNDGICINGVLYYVSQLDEPVSSYAIVCFDVMSEKFSFINKAENMILWSGSTLVNYKGLGALLSSDGFPGVTGETKWFELWVLVDTEKHEWSKRISVSSPLWKNIFTDAAELFFVGVTGTNDIVLSPQYLSDPFYVYYYNIESNTIKRVQIQGMNTFKNFRVHISLDYVEDVKLMQYGGLCGV